MNSLKQMQDMHYPKATFEDVSGADGIAGTDIKPEALADYLAHFIPPSKDQKCVCCGNTLGITWGMVHGEAYCYHRDCRYPVRVYHFPEIDGVKHRFVRAMQYHPDVLQDPNAESTEGR